MSNPVDTDALRSSSRFLRKAYPGTAAQVHAAADEVDRLRAELAISENRSGGYEEVVAELRAVIENAPHPDDCNQVNYVPWSCTCWKADAL